MPTGNPGSTLVSELNRLANGGTYPPISEYVDEAAAARAWAANSGTTITVTDTVGVLNEIAEITDQKNWLDFNGVCNYIAGTSGLAAAAALRTIGGITPGNDTWNSYSPTATWATTSPSITWLTV